MSDMIQRIKHDLSRAFELHGVRAELEQASKEPVSTNSLGESLYKRTDTVPQLIIDRSRHQKLLEEMVGSISDGELHFLTPEDTLIIESSIIQYNGCRYHVKSMIPKKVFQECIAYIGYAERADGHNADTS